MPALLEIGLGNALAAALLALVAVAGSRFCRHPAIVHGLWLLVFIKLLTPPLLPIPLSWERADQVTQGEPEPVIIEAKEPAPVDHEALAAHLRQLEQAPEDADPVGPEPPVSVSQTITLLWLGGSALWFAWTAAYLLRFRRLLRHGAAASAELQQRVHDLAGRLGLRRVPAVFLVPGQLSPMVWSFFGRPRLLFPARLLETVTTAQQDTLILHELAHIARRDHLVRWLELAASGLYWWLPVVWLARRGLHAAEEECCDARVTRALPDSGRDYALALVATLAFLSPVRPGRVATASGVGPVPQIKRRLTMILRGRSNHALSWLGGLVVLTLGVLLLPWAPSLAQEPKDKPISPAELRRQQIKVLRDLLKNLEEQQRAAEKDSTAQQIPMTWQALEALGVAGVQDARHQKAVDAGVRWLAAQSLVDRKRVWELKAMIEQARAQLANAQAHVQLAEMRLKELQAQFDELKAKAAPESPKSPKDTKPSKADDKRAPAHGQVEAVRLRSANAAEVARALDQLFNGADKEPRKDRVVVIAEPISNSLLIRASQADLAAIRAVLEKLDAKNQQPKDEAKPRPKPSPENVKGKVTRVGENELPLIEVDVGADAGLEKGHTLEVFRLEPRPEYVGVLRIVDSQTNRAVGRMIQPTDRQTLVKVGDRVASSLR